MAYMLGDIQFENINLRNGAYTPFKAYSQSKLANILFTRQLAKLLGPHSNIKTYSLHPGTIQTELSRHILFSNILAKITNTIGLIITPEMGAQTTLYCALEESIENESGSYYE